MARSDKQVGRRRPTRTTHSRHLANADHWWCTDGHFGPFRDAGSCCSVGKCRAGMAGFPESLEGYLHREWKYARREERGLFSHRRRSTDADPAEEELPLAA